MSEWQPIESAPKTIVAKHNGGEYGKYILAYPVHGDVGRVRWWQSAGEHWREQGYQNFIADGGLAVSPTHWMPLPAPPSNPMTLEREKE